MIIKPFDCAPVLLIGFNRPDYMAEQIAAVRPARPSRLYISVDGPRSDRPEEGELCRKVRECAELVDWTCEVKTLFREKNLGCKYGVSGAITWFFENESEGIVLEDDCRPAVDFFRFATENCEPLQLLSPLGHRHIMESMLYSVSRIFQQKRMGIRS